MATRDKRQSKESVFLVDDAGGTPVLYRPETPALTAESILERSRQRCEPVRLPLLDNVRRGAKAGAGRLSATERAIKDRAANLGLRVRASRRIPNGAPDDCRCCDYRAAGGRGGAGAAPASDNRRKRIPSVRRAPGTADDPRANTGPGESGDGREAERSWPTLRSVGRPCCGCAGEGPLGPYVRFPAKGRFTRARRHPAGGLETFGGGSMDQRRPTRSHAAEGHGAAGGKQGRPTGTSGLRTLVLGCQHSRQQAHADTGQTAARAPSHDTRLLTASSSW